MKTNQVNFNCIVEQHFMSEVLRRLKPNVGSMPAMLLIQTQVCTHPIITDVHILKMELTTPCDLQPPTHPPAAILEGVTAGHLHVHMSNSGLLSAFLRLRLIYKSACAVSHLHISQHLWTLSAFVFCTFCTYLHTLYRARAG